MHFHHAPHQHDDDPPTMPAEMAGFTPTPRTPVEPQIFDEATTEVPVITSFSPAPPPAPAEAEAPAPGSESTEELFVDQATGTVEAAEPHADEAGDTSTQTDTAETAAEAAVNERDGEADGSPSPSPWADSADAAEAEEAAATEADAEAAAETEVSADAEVDAPEQAAGDAEAQARPDADPGDHEAGEDAVAEADSAEAEPTAEESADGPEPAEAEATAEAAEAEATAEAAETAEDADAGDAETPAEESGDAGATEAAEEATGADATGAAPDTDEDERTKVQAALEPTVAAVAAEVETEIEVVATAQLRPGDVAETPVAVWSEEEVQRFRADWRELQVQFIDEPAAAVEGAKRLVTEAVETLAQSLLAQQEQLDPRHESEHPDTEALRVAMRRYREFLDRILAL